MVTAAGRWPESSPPNAGQEGWAGEVLVLCHHDLADGPVVLAEVPS